MIRVWKEQKSFVNRGILPFSVPLHRLSMQQMNQHRASQAMIMGTLDDWPSSSCVLPIKSVLCFHDKHNDRPRAGQADMVIPFQLSSQRTIGAASQNLLWGRHGPLIYYEQHHCSQLSAKNLNSNRKYWLNHDSAYVDNSAVQSTICTYPMITRDKKN